MNNSKDLILKAKDFYNTKKFFEAKSKLVEALDDKKLNTNLKLNIFILISDICYKLNEFEDAEIYLLKSINQGKSNSEMYNSLGNIYLKKRNYKKAEKFYLKSIDLNEENEVAIINLAIFYHNLGNQNKAKFFYDKVLKINPKNIAVLYNLSNIDQSSINKKKIENLKNLIDKNGLNNFDLASGYFLLASEERRKKNFNKEIKFIQKANNYSFKTNENKNKQNNRYWLNIIPSKFDKIDYKKKDKVINHSKNIFPIFIVGLPRCGSTLIESIISSGEKKIENLGETNLVNWAFINTNKEFLQNSINKNDKENYEINFSLIFNKLIKVFENLNIKKTYEKVFFSEKSLENFFYIELILNIYPNAKFINPYRNLTDNIFAIYKQFLPNVSWSHSIEDILIYIDNYLSTIDYFKKKYPKKIFSISLENFTKNPLQESKNIFKFCNLEWNRKCLEFHKRNDLFSNTASKNQIRSSIQKYNKNKYEVYRQLINQYKKKYKWID